ncbi:MAG: FecR domain-containing protein [Burkholderiales bacterium]|nr:FecR domain-containing protein [Burkholderiales bacterium]
MTTSTFRFLFVWALFLFGSSHALAAPIAYVHELTGTLQLQYGKSAPQDLKIGSTIEPGGILSTGDQSSAVVKFEDGQLMVMQPNSRFAVRQYDFVKTNVAKSSAVFELLRGGLRFVTGMIGATNKKSFKLTAGTATIGIRGSDGYAEFDPVADAVNVAVLAGALAISNPLGTTGIGVGTFSTSTRNAAPGRPSPLAQATPAVKASLAAVAAKTLPINTPAVVQAAAKAAVAKAAADAADLAVQAATTDAERQAAQLAADQARAEADDALQTAVQEAQAVMDAAVQNGGVVPEPAAPAAESTSGATATESTSSAAEIEALPAPAAGPEQPAAAPTPAPASSGSGGGGVASPS